MDIAFFYRRGGRVLGGESNYIGILLWDAITLTEVAAVSGLGINVVKGVIGGGALEWRWEARVDI